MRLPDPARVTALLEEVSAQEILSRFHSLRPDQIHQKSGPNDLVTEADVEAERVLTRRLSDLLPGSVVLGEEAYAADPAVLDRVHGEAPVWIIDPVDGTYNFARHDPTFGTLLALCRGGEILAGWIHDPLGGRTIVSMAGAGTWDGATRLWMDQQVEPTRMVGAINRPIYAPDEGGVRHPAFAGTFNLFCAAHEYLRLVTGQGHFAQYYKTMPWDHAAGVLAVREAGGHAATRDGQPYRPTRTEGGLLVAPNPDAWQKIAGLIWS